MAKLSLHNFAWRANSWLAEPLCPVPRAGCGHCRGTSGVLLSQGSMMEMRNTVFERRKMATVLCEGCTERDWKVWQDCGGLDHETSLCDISLRVCAAQSGFKNSKWWLPSCSDPPGNFRLLKICLSFCVCIVDQGITFLWSDSLLLKRNPPYTRVVGLCWGWFQWCQAEPCVSKKTSKWGLESCLQ